MKFFPIIESYSFTSVKDFTTQHVLRAVGYYDPQKDKNIFFLNAEGDVYVPKKYVETNDGYFDKASNLKIGDMFKIPSNKHSEILYLVIDTNLDTMKTKIIFHECEKNEFHEVSTYRKTVEVMKPTRLIER